MKLTFDTVLTVHLEAADYDAVSLASDHTVPDEGDRDIEWCWFSDCSPRVEVWASADRLREVRFSGKAEAVRQEVTDWLASNPSFHYVCYVRFVRRTT
jgi:hypothetical protein